MQKEPSIIEKALYHTSRFAERALYTHIHGTWVVEEAYLPRCNNTLQQYTATTHCNNAISAVQCNTLGLLRGGYIIGTAT